MSKDKGFMFAIVSGLAVGIATLGVMQLLEELSAKDKPKKQR